MRYLKAFAAAFSKPQSGAGDDRIRSASSPSQHLEKCPVLSLAKLCASGAALRDCWVQKKAQRAAEDYSKA
eukprot:3081023-Karenia_brevis.AAC.1